VWIRHAGGEVADRPNILFFHVDNLGFGELSCYAGGPFRGARTERIDAFAAQGFRLTNYCPESQCSPTRSALLTGRHAIRSGTHSAKAFIRASVGEGRPSFVHFNHSLMHMPVIPAGSSASSRPASTANP
jgi:arylsulfatase A-like enzyme